MARGFGLTVEDDYISEVQPVDDVNIDWFQKMPEVNFELGDEVETDDGGGRTDEIFWAGAAKPNGSTSAKVDLQRLTYYLYGFLDHYLHTTGEDDLHIHEFWGGENHELPSFSGIAMYDELKLALFGLLIDGLKLEVSDGAMDVNVDWLYSTETYRTLEENEDFIEPEELVNSKIPVRFYDVFVYLDGKDGKGYKKPGATQTSWSMEGNNNHDQEGTIGLGSRFPQEHPQAQKRTINLSLATTLNRRSYKTIMDARYGQADARQPDRCRVLTVGMKLEVIQCENPAQKLIIEFPNCTLRSEFDLKGADRVEATLNLQSIGNSEITLADNTTKVFTDMYVQLINNVPEMGVDATP